MAILINGSYFGELALLATARRVATCAALTHCDLNVLNSSDLQMTMKDFPMSSALVKAWAVSRLASLVSLAFPFAAVVKVLRAQAQPLVL